MNKRKVVLELLIKLKKPRGAKVLFLNCLLSSLF